MRLIKTLLCLSCLVSLLLVGYLVWFATSQTTQTGEVLVSPGSVRKVSQQLVAQNMTSSALALEILIRISGQSPHIKAGYYEVPAGTNMLDLIAKLSSGDQQQDSITFIEGWQFSQVRAAIDAHSGLRHMTMAYTDMELMNAIKVEVLDKNEIWIQANHPEGLFFPDTYFFIKGARDLDIYKRAYLAMQKKLRLAWAQRSVGLPYQQPYQALIMASIVEKETGSASERPEIAGVFMNRLHLNMRLQTDPTVIYGLGEKFDGNLRKKDLLMDQAYNTYTRHGLPPTPIAMPGLASIQAALHPAQTSALYFVGKGDGTHSFSNSLEAHNRAVQRYQRSTVSSKTGVAVNE